MACKHCGWPGKSMQAKAKVSQSKCKPRCLLEQQLHLQRVYYTLRYTVYHTRTLNKLRLTEQSSSEFVETFSPPGLRSKRSLPVISNGNLPSPESLLRSAIEIGNKKICKSPQGSGRELARVYNVDSTLASTLAWKSPQEHSAFLESSESTKCLVCIFSRESPLDASPDRYRSCDLY